MSFPALVGRNPFPLLALLIVVLVVRSAWAPALARDAGWTLILRFALVVSVVSVLFNVVTAPFGDQVIATLPGWWPLGDVVTLNALVYGLLSAVAVIVILLAGTTAGLLADWPELLRSVPARFLPLAVAGSVAWAFVPRTVATIRDIRDAQRVRGVRLTSARSLLPLLVPLLATSLERATTMAEALEARGFGGVTMAAAGERRSRPGRSLAGALGLTLVVAAGYLWLDGSGVVAVPAGVVGGVLLALALAAGDHDRRTRYRDRVWRRRDTLVLASAAGSLAVTGWALVRDAASLRYSPYPGIDVPAVDLPLVVAIGLLLAPAAVAPLVPVRPSTVRSSSFDDEAIGRPGRTSSGHARPFGGERTPRRSAPPLSPVPSGPGHSPVPDLHPAGRSLRRLPNHGRGVRPWAAWPVRRRRGAVPGRTRPRALRV